MTLTPLAGGRVYRLERPARRGRWLRNLRHKLLRRSALGFGSHSVTAS